MTHLLPHRSAGLLCLVFALLTCPAATAHARQQPAGVLLDVPYLSQTDQLCGGAALAMVLRFWGERDVFAQDFSPLLDRGTGGIVTNTLRDAAIARGWAAVARTAPADAPGPWLREEIARKRPVIALVQTGSDTYHYVVVTGATPEQVVFHDPARAPHQVLSQPDFDERWAAAGRWTLVVLPDATRPTPRPAPATASAAITRTTPTACEQRVMESVGLARSGRLADAERGLMTLSSSCATTSSVWLELAGLRFVQERYDETVALARRALSLAPTDAAAWELLATTLYLQGDVLGALEAWNTLGRPRTDVVSIAGVQRLDHPVAVKLTGLQPRQLLTPERFQRAERKLSELPSASSVALMYHPAPDGTASVQATVDERTVLPKGKVAWGLVGIETAFRREVRLPISSPLRQGERWTLRYRWSENRPRIGATIETPAPGRLPGVLALDAWWERRAFASPGDTLRTARRRVSLGLSDWTTSHVRWAAAAGADRFEAREYVSVQGLIDTRWFDDRVATGVGVSHWRATSGARPFSVLDAHVSLRTRPEPRRQSWSSHAGFIVAGQAAPPAVWPVAGSSPSADAVLRGHNLFDTGILTSEVFGRRLAFATVEYQRPIYAHKFGSIALAGFLDTAKAWRRLALGPPSPFHVDVGIGVRISQAGGDTQLRLDIGYGLRDGASKISAGYSVPWGR